MARLKQEGLLLEVVMLVKEDLADFMNNDPDFPERFRDAYRYMLLARTLEDKIASLYRAGGKIVGGVYVGRGQETFSVAMGLALERGDVFAPLIRDQAARLAFGEPLLDATRTYLGSVLGPMRGRDGNIHRGRPREGMPAMISHLGAMISVVSGMLFARRLRGNDHSIGATSLGEGATSTGAFHEALNLAAVERLPLVIAVANNQYAYSTPTSRQFACRHLVDRAAGYGIRGYAVDGLDLAACLQVFATAARRAREGDGPQLVVGSLLRLAGHGEHDDASYVSAALRNGPLGRDCLELAEQRLRDEGWVEIRELEAWKKDASLRVDAAMAQAQKEPGPDALKEKWCALASSKLSQGIPS